MQDKNEIAIFENKKIRRSWHEEDWWVSVVDIVGALTESERPRKYWNDLKFKISEEGFQLSEKFGQLKLQSEDGKYYETDCANLEGIFRIIQSISSPKAEPFKLWLAKVGYQRIEGNIDPELIINRVLDTYLRKGHSI